MNDAVELRSTSWMRKWRIAAARFPPPQQSKATATRHAGQQTLFALFCQGSVRFTRALAARQPPSSHQASGMSKQEARIACHRRSGVGFYRNLRNCSRTRARAQVVSSSSRAQGGRECQESQPALQQGCRHGSLPRTSRRAFLAPPPSRRESAVMLLAGPGPAVGNCTAGGSAFPSPGSMGFCSSHCGVPGNDSATWRTKLRSFSQESVSFNSFG